MLQTPLNRGQISRHLKLKSAAKFHLSTCPQCTTPFEFQSSGCSGYRSGPKAFVFHWFSADGAWHQLPSVYKPICLQGFVLRGFVKPTWPSIWILAQMIGFDSDSLRGAALCGPRAPPPHPRGAAPRGLGGLRPARRGSEGR